MSTSASAAERFESTRQASSTTRIRLRWAPSVSAATCACTQPIAAVIRIAIALDSATAERSSTTSGASRSRPGEVSPSNMPAASPSQSRSSASAASRDSASQCSADDHRSRHASAGGASSTRTTRGSVATSCIRRTARSAWASAASSAGASARSRQAAATPRSARTSTCSSPLRDWSGLSTTPPPGARRIGSTPNAAARRSYSPRFGDTTIADRPKTAHWRCRYAFTNALLPRPISPSTTIAGPVRSPRS